MREYGLFIGGKFVNAASGKTVTSVDPSNGSPVAAIAKAGPKDARRAIDAARRAFDETDWRARSITERRDVLLRVCDLLDERAPEIAELEARDAGMTIRLATSMVTTAIGQARALVRAAASLPSIEQIEHTEADQSSSNMLVRDPYGVVVAITAFTAPFAQAVGKVFPALVMGNSVILKPSPLTPCSAMELGVAFSMSDVPSGMINVLPGADVEAAEELITNPLVDRISFTGSTDVGRRISHLASQTVKRVTLELGGKGAGIVLDDADLDVAIPGSLWAIYLHQGQTCQAGSRLFVPAAQRDEILDRLIAGAAQLRLGPTLAPESDLGPLISQGHLDRVERSVRIGRDAGAELVTGGRRVTEDGLDTGFYYAPTIFSGVTNDMRIAQEEILGPVLSVLTYTDIEQAVAAANATPYGLTAGVWGRDPQRALTTAMRLQAGTVWVNEWHATAALAPTGGYKQSGFGKGSGAAGCLEYAQTKHVWVDRSPGGKPRGWDALLGFDRLTF